MPEPSESGSRSLARLLTSLLLVLALAPAALPDAFGRFGYGALPVPGFLVTREGFKANSPAADMFRFGTPADKWKPVDTSDKGQTIFVTDRPGGPQKLRVDLLAPGFLMYSTGELALSLSSSSSPILTWSEGSVENGVLTPPSKWLTVSFRDFQPPLILGFIDGPAIAGVEGQIGAWRLKVSGYKGWIRVALPLGLKPLPTNTAADLGKLAQSIAPDADFWASPTPILVSTTYSEDDGGITATWRFDRAGATLPPPIILAPLGGYYCKLISPARRLLDDLDKSGPLYILEGQELKVRFPIRRVPTGRSVGIGTAVESPTAADEIGVISEAALANLSCLAGPEMKARAQSALDRFVSEARYEIEPATAQRLPFSADGAGLELLAAHALLMQSIETTERGTSDANSLLTSLAWRRDWLTWKLWGPNAEQARRATALASLGCALCPEPGRRLEGAMMEAGLAADRGLQVWYRRIGVSRPAENLVEPLDDLRKAIFADSPSEDSFVQGLSSDLRVFGKIKVAAQDVDAGIVLSFEAPTRGSQTLILASGDMVQISGWSNTSSVKSSQGFGFIFVKVKPLQPGPCSIFVGRPSWSRPLPSLAAPPRYTESYRSEP